MGGNKKLFVGKKSSDIKTLSDNNDDLNWHTISADLWNAEGC